jgi:tRNA A-37 threonylcarbamoyl transferase component Bud32
MLASQVRVPPPPITRGHKYPLPDDLLREASRRLGIMSLVGAALWVLGTLLGRIAFGLMEHGGARWGEPEASDAIAIVSVLVSLALYVYTRKSKRDPRFLLDLGLAYLVYTSLALGLMMHWDPSPGDLKVRPMISWVGPVVLMFAAIVPNTPRKTLIAGLIAASMNPLSMLVARAWEGWDFGPTSNVLLMHYADYLLVGVSVVIAHVMTKLGQQVTKAREMGSYQLGELLGRGGMGEVYKATHRMLARPAAIKLIRPETLRAVNGEAAELAVKRFRREAEAAASLRSPHTVELYDFGVTEDQTLYFVMELLEGMDLETLVREHGPLPAGRVIHILLQVCESLEEAHVSGLVHRDIKPANIHLGRLGLRHDFVKVLDFGLVKPVSGKSDEHSLATAAGLTPGTPAYMAPEMAMGETVDGRADLYAVGCVAYYLLTGKLVFEAENTFQLIVKHLRSEPVPPSQRTELEIPQALEQLVMACLAKKPDDRPRSAGELARSLAAIEVEPWGEEQATQWWTAIGSRLPQKEAQTAGSAH